MASTHKSLRSSTANKRPTTAIADGQIALNTNTTSPGLFFKDSTGATIIKVGPVHVGATAPNASPAVGGSSGNSTGEVWLDTSLTPNGVKIWNGSAWVNVTPAGSTTVQGLLELATSAETQTGSDTDRAVTPAGLQSKVSDSTSTTSSTTIASSTAVKSAYDLANAALPKSGGTVTGNLEIGTTGSLTFEGSVNDTFETAIAVVNPTADRTITLPDTTGTVVTTGDTGTVTGTMLANNVALPGAPTATTAAVGTNTTQIATTAFVNSEIANDAPTKTGGGASGTWGINITGSSASCTGNAATATTATSAVTPTFSGDSVGKDNITTRTDSGFYETSTGTTAEGWPTNSNGWHHLISCTHTNDTFYYAMQLAARFDTQNWYLRNTNGSGTQSWSTMLHSNNYTSYAPTLTGTGASGTWGISITGRGYPRRSDGADLNFFWSGQSGQPTWLWGGNDGTNMYVYNPSNFSVNYANTAGRAYPRRSDGTEVSFIWSDPGGQPSYIWGGSDSINYYVWSRNNLVVGGINNNIQIGGLDFSISTTTNRTSGDSGRLHLCDSGADTTSNVFTVQRSGSNGKGIRFARGTTLVGDVTINASSVTYNTTSDYRLKENITPLANAINRLKNLSPCRFNFIAEPGNTVDGFLAHEVQPVVPEAVRGEKDAMEPIGAILNADGSIATENVVRSSPSELEEGQHWEQNGEQPDYQGMDNSKLVPLLTAALQELVARVEALELA
jgi:hypothetical protein